MSWPVLQGQELAALKGAFASPLQLQAAFDGRDEAAELVEAFMPGISNEGKLQRADILVEWAREQGHTLKKAEKGIFLSHVGDVAAVSCGPKSPRGL